MAAASTSIPKTGRIPFWRDIRVLGAIGQVIFMVLVLTSLGWLIRNFLVNAQNQGLKLGFDFLSTTAAFDIKEGIPFEATETFGRALWVGIVNTIRVSLIGIVLTTIVALIVGIARLSNNWLVSKTAALYIEIVRNIPLLVLLFFLYAVVLKLPSVKDSIQPFGWPVYLNQRGVALPSLVPTSGFPLWLAFIILAVILVLVLWTMLSRQEERTGRSIGKTGPAAVAFIAVVGLGWLVTSAYNSDQAILVAARRNIERFEDFEKIFLVKLDEKALKKAGVDQATLDRLNSAAAVAAYKAELEGQLAVPDLGEDGAQAIKDQLSILNKAAITVCAVGESPAEINAFNQLRGQNISVELNSGKDLAEAGEAYAKDDCDLLAGSRIELVAERALLKKPAEHEVVPIQVGPLVISNPAPAGFNLRGGIKLSPEFAALLAGLVIFTGAFAAEIVRAGILAVSKGQSEAARALGLSEGQRLRLIVLPQALRVIIPPMTSQYLNLTKNSSLAVAIAYPDLVSVGNTVMNQSGLAVQVIIIFMISYLIISLVISAFLNWYNQSIMLVER